jgi:hypothetical protein
MEDSFRRPSLGAAVSYEDPLAALNRLEEAFGFERDRVYSARDPEGHVWSFGQTVRRVSRQEAEKASGPKTEGWA